MALHKVEAGGYTIVHTDRINWLNYEAVEKRYKAKYVGEFTLKTKNGGWADTPVAVFYQKEIPEAYKGIGSHHFGVYRNDEHVMIADARSAVEHTWVCALNEDTKELLYSAYQHDYQTMPNGSDMMADGGPEYTRSSVHTHKAFKIVNDTLKVLE